MCQPIGQFPEHTKTKLPVQIIRRARSVFEIIGKSHYQGKKDPQKKASRNIGTECDMILAIFLAKFCVFDLHQLNKSPC